VDGVTELNEIKTTEAQKNEIMNPFASVDVQSELSPYNGV
jgi:hypothetical protein